MTEAQDVNYPYRIEPLPRNEDEVRARHEANRAAWNEGAIYYSTNLDQSIARLRSGQSNLHPVERRNLGDLHHYPTAIHLQCASGQDTLSLWLEGVDRVIGIDISDVHIENARRMSAVLEAPAEWYRCDLLDAPHSLDGTADLVYTGRGAICWLQDLGGWAKVIHRLLKPGGVFHILDDHPITWLFDQAAQSLQYSGTNYFGLVVSDQGWPDTYIGDALGIPVEQQAIKYERLWTMSDLVNSLLRAGLVIEFLGEHPEPYWNSFPHIPVELQACIPMTLSIMARRPVGQPEETR